MPYDAKPDLLDRDLVFDFFWKFSVFECAMKREGFLASSGREESAEPNWKKFGESVVGRFKDVHSDGFKEAVTTLEESPPRRQVVRGGRLAWEELNRRHRESHEEFILRLVKTARNNLFHGGKYPDGLIAEIARDRVVLKAALKVLEGCYELHPGIARWAREAA